jgi:hypothetical protein
MICQLGRFYADAPVALAICFEHNHQASVAHEAVKAAHHHSHDAAASESESDVDPRFKIEHCRDTYLGMNLIPATVLTLPAETFAIMPQSGAILMQSFESTRIQEPILSVFHPPQLLS